MPLWLLTSPEHLRKERNPREGKVNIRVILRPAFPTTGKLWLSMELELQGIESISKTFTNVACYSKLTTKLDYDYFNSFQSLK